MEIKVVVENTSAVGMPVEHGLSLWIEACGRRFFFDLGQGTLFAENAKAMGINVDDAEFAVISHGHFDHGGGIATFLSANDHAKVILNRNAFADYWSLHEEGTRYIGLDKELRESDRVQLIDGNMSISEGLTLVQGSVGHEYFSPANIRILKKENGRMLQDDFLHEQSLIIREGERCVLIAGCAHSGILNIMEKAERVIGMPLTDVVAGMHLMGVDDQEFVNGMAEALMQRDCRYFTCHCTTVEAYEGLRLMMGEKIGYISCGESITIG